MITTGKRELSREPKKDDTGQSIIITPPHGKGIPVAVVFGLIEDTGQYSASPPGIVFLCGTYPTM